jgi:[Skp1-protein]-hydroxyproline N-acetylglucosaminyltransferase
METIFVSIASYRDPVCTSTLESLYSQAKNPEKIFCGVVQQNHQNDADCVRSAAESVPINNVRIIRMDNMEAKGAVWARWLCSTLYNNETYYFQIDSHTKFVKDWDITLINMIKEIKEKNLSQKPVISHYPDSMESYTDSPNGNMVTRICSSFWNTRDMLSFLGAESIDSKGEYYPTPYVSGGMLFTEGIFLKDVPYPDDAMYLFVGEEILHSIRLYTSGYDIFCPNKNVIFHEYTRADKPKIWTDKVYTDTEAFEKVKKLIGISDGSLNDYRYGLGKIRTLNDYYTFAGISLRDRKVYKNFCRENNIATAEDILKSNENTSNFSQTITLFIIFTLAGISVILFIYFILIRLKDLKIHRI